jgi:hypothetical protein|tara:strand:+ start:2331 stop:2834 length:504 start_codon:yes stop_codon:yes gene_type:complete
MLTAINPVSKGASPRQSLAAMNENLNFQRRPDPKGTLAGTMVTASAAIKEAEQKIRDAIMREAIARSASASAAKAQVSAEAEVLVLRAAASRLRDELRATEHALEVSSSANTASASTHESLVAENHALRAAHASATSEVHDLNTVLRARSMDITQLGQVIIDVYQGM